MEAKKWEDTVIKETDKALDFLDTRDAEMQDIRDILQLQAEISFKAGMEEEASGGHNSISFLEGYQEGEKLAKEVVDYFFYEAGIVRLMGCSTMEECIKKLPNWQTKLKSWGIKED